MNETKRFFTGEVFAYPHPILKFLIWRVLQFIQSICGVLSYTIEVLTLGFYTPRFLFSFALHKLYWIDSIEKWLDKH